MLFESEGLAAVIATPPGISDDREDEMFTGLGDECWRPTDLRLDQSHKNPDRCDLVKSTHRRMWISLVTSILGRLRSRMRRRRQIRGISAAWAMVDDRTLNDIGISRLALEHAADLRRWADRIA